MDSVVTWNVSQYAVMGLALGLFGFLGFRRGVNRELLSLIGVGIGMLLATQFASSLVPSVNRFYKLGRLAMSGGLASDNPLGAWQSVQQLPALVRTPEDIELLGMIVFLMVFGFSYLISQKCFPAPESLTLRILGLGLGVITGFLFIYYLMPIIFYGSTMVITLPSGEVRNTLFQEQGPAKMAALFVLVLIVFGVYTASGAKKRK